MGRSAAVIRVLLIDDAPVLRRTLASALDASGPLHVVACGSAVDEVRSRLLDYHPEVLLLRLDPLQSGTFALLRQLRVNYPVPLIALVESGPERAATTQRAHELGAVAVTCLPRGSDANSITRSALGLAKQVEAAATQMPALPQPYGLQTQRSSFRAAGIDPSRYLLALGASTGGTEALTALLRQAPPDLPPTLIVQHMPATFTNAFAERLNSLCAVRVREARDGAPLEIGSVLIARGDTHLWVQAKPERISVRVSGQQLVNRHCPSVDVLFDSVAATVGRYAIGVLLTGMGVDGARGMLNLHRAGALTIAQDATSCVVYGMPREAVKLQAVDHQAAPAEIPALLVKLLRQRAARTSLKGVAPAPTKR